MGQVQSACAIIFEGVQSAVGSVIRTVAVIADYFVSVIYEPVRIFMESMAPFIAESKRPESLTKYGTLDEDTNKIEDEKRRIEQENPGIASEWAKIKQKAINSGTNHRQDIVRQ